MNTFSVSLLLHLRAFPVVQMVKNPHAMQTTWVLSLRQEDPLEEGLTIPSSILAWRIPWTETPKDHFL